MCNIGGRRYFFLLIGISTFLVLVIKHTGKVVIGHFEPFFVNAMAGPTKITIGVTYNPPSGEDKRYLTELMHLLEKCPKENLYFRTR